MIDAGTCCADARYGSHVHQPEAASAENQRRVTQPVVRSIAHPKSVGSIRCAHDLQAAARPPPSLAAAAALGRRRQVDDVERLRLRAPAAPHVVQVLDPSEHARALVSP